MDDDAHRAGEVALDLPVLAFLLGVSVLTGIAFGVLPALQQRHGQSAAATLRDGARGATAAGPRFNAALLALFAVAALLLAAVGIYGVLSYTVAQRTGEIGIRLALGAEQGRVVRQVIAQGLGVALAGLAVGVVAPLALGRVLTSLLMGVSGRDPLVLATVVVLLTLTALAAAWLPARRASRVEPVVALRAE